jgi:hypothetical protein
MHDERKIRRSDLFDAGGWLLLRHVVCPDLSFLTVDGAAAFRIEHVRSCVHVRRQRAAVMLRARDAVVRRMSSARAFGADLA